MSSKKAIIISAAASALILVLTFGVIKVVAQIGNSGSSSSLTQKITQREDAYRQLINEANQRIQDLNDQVQGGGITAPQTALTVDAALAIAYQTTGSGQTLAGVPQLVNYEGAAAYEIPFMNGLIYIDAETGAVLSNAVLPVIDEQKAVEIAAAYLGTTNLSAARVTTLTVDGTEVFQVTIANYVIFVDKFGTITKVQVLQYSAPSSGSQSSGSSGGGEREHEHEDDDD